MRPKFNRQVQFDFQASPLKVTSEYYARYEAISKILDQNPQLVDAVQSDIHAALDEELDPETGVATYCCCTETVLRLIVCQVIERCSLRRIIIRADDSNFLRRFVRIYNDPMIDFTTLARLRNRIRPETWQRVHELLNQWAVRSGRVTGKKLRLDTTAVETNIHWPTDSALLWDSYRVLARLLKRLRRCQPGLIRKRRLHPRRVRRLYLSIARRARRRAAGVEALKPLYSRLIEQVATLNRLVDDTLERLTPEGVSDPARQALGEQLRHYRALSERVVDQARRRTLQGETVSNPEKLFSIFEPHTELLKRGKAVRDIEFGHMIQIQQVEGKYITGYKVFQTKPTEATLLEPALKNHKALFGVYPREVSADKGYAQSSEQLVRLSRKVKHLGVGKAGTLTAADCRREHTLRFRLAQRFRAGVEGTISYLKRALGLARCLTKGWSHYAAGVGAALLAHNLLILARG
jgi:IS5 family transposase